MNTDLFKGNTDYWAVSDTIKHLYMSDGSMVTLMDFERVLDEMDMYAYQNWSLGELVEGPEVSRYSVSCTFLWPENLMPDPRAGKRLFPFGCQIAFMKTTMKVPVKVESEDDFRPGTKKPRLKDVTIWLVEIVMPKDLISDIRTGSVELEGEKIDLEDLDLAYEDNIEEESVVDNQDEEFADELENQQMDDEEQPFGDAG